MEPGKPVALPELPVRCVAGEVIRHLAEQHGDRDLAVLGDRRLTYRDAEQQSAAIARGLLATGVGKGTRVGILAGNGPEWITAWLAASRVGAVTVLLNTYAPARELAWALRHGDVAVLLTVAEHLGHRYLDRLEEAVEGLVGQPHGSVRATSHPYLRTVWVLDGASGGDTAADGHVEADDLAGDDTGADRRSWARPIADLVAVGVDVSDELLAAVEAEVHPADPMVIVYSSGSTSDPKGAIHTQAATLGHGLRLLEFRRLGPGDRVYTPMPLFWVGGLSFALVRCLHAGATLVLEERFDPPAMLALLERERVTHVLGWPHMGPALVGDPTFAERDLSSIRGGGLPELLPDQLRPADPGRLPSSLGMTETLGPHSVDVEGLDRGEAGRGSFGRAVPGMEHRVVDPDTGEAVPVGVEGELWVRGRSLMVGLHKRERHEVFTPDGWYRTGDGGHLGPDGSFYFTGRLGDLIKSAGMNITPREVEAAIEAGDDVARAVVVGVPSAERGEDVVAVVVPMAGRLLSADALRSRLRGELSSYKVPRRIEVVTHDDDLPWLDSGKVDRRALAARLATDPSPT